MQSHWYESFFQGLSVELWEAVTTPEMTLTEVNFFEQALTPSAGARILDIPCGGGRHAIEFARRGYRMTGLDISSEFLAIAEQNAASEGLHVQWIQGNMLSPPAGPFDAAYCYGNSFGYLPHRDTVAFLSGIGRCVRPGGRFLLETGTAAETILPTLQPYGDYTVQGIRMETRRDYRFEDSMIQSVYTFTRGGQVESHQLEQAVYTTGEICRMLGAAGFSIAALYSGTDGAPLKLGTSRRLLVVAERTP
ncbi:MAG: class I SAM-dependent methyltransferase [Acidobacteria bacterium]|nr:class I SAM-dependent methyltransferase [Acidobacteriota bacterium]